MFKQRAQGHCNTKQSYPNLENKVTCPSTPGDPMTMVVVFLATIQEWFVLVFFGNLSTSQLSLHPKIS